MEILSIVLTAVNVILTILSAIGTYRSLRYYKKSKRLASLVKANQSLAEVEKMLNRIPDLLDISYQIRCRKRGYNYHIALCEVGKELYASLNQILSEMPLKNADEFNSLLEKDGFSLRDYINSIINGDVLNEEDGIRLEEYSRCQNRLLDMQMYLRNMVENIEEDFK